METNAILALWSRSIEKYKLHYRFMVCDSDAKSNIVETVYGESEEDKVIALDCINHIGKRMFRDIENCWKTNAKVTLSDGQKVGGGKRRLTAGQSGVTGRLSELNRNAIRQNVKPRISRHNTGESKSTDVHLKCYILTSLTTVNKFCPDGEESWCVYKKNGTPVDDSKGHYLDLVDLLEPIFVRLSNKDLLERCIEGFTQNQNESFNSLVWKRLPKHLWRGPSHVKAAICLAILQWNLGALRARQHMLDALMLPSGVHTVSLSTRKDKIRWYDSKRKADE